jgi:predicted DNA-binding transcriptional regulator YafY
MTREVEIDYTNYRGKRAVRRVKPLDLTFRSTEWHPEMQWVMRAFDVEKQEIRFFAMKDIHSWNSGRRQR